MEQNEIERVYQRILSQAPDGDLQKRVALIRWIEDKLRTDFKSTDDFHQKIRNFLEGHGTRPGLRLKKARKKLEMNQFELASLLNCTQSIVSDWEAGKKPLTDKAIKFIELAENGHSKAEISTILGEL